MTEPPPPPDPILPPDPYRDLDTQDPGSRLTADEVEFGLAMREYQLRRHRRYPAWCEVLYVLRLLGYAKADRTDGREGSSALTPVPTSPAQVGSRGGSPSPSPPAL